MHQPRTYSVLRIGYNRAARLMDELEEAGVIGAYDEENKTRASLPSSTIVS